MFQIVDQIKQAAHFRLNGLHKFKPKIILEIDTSQYIVKTATTAAEILEGFKLRHQVFFNEDSQSSSAGLDFDRFDFHFDHLIIVHKASHRIIGTYRLNCSDQSPESYTGLEFDLSLLKLQPGASLELGRACIHSDYRKGSVISLLWRGIATYMNLSKANWLFGCTSLTLQDSAEAALVFRYLELQNKVNLEFLCRPQSRYCIENFDFWYSYYSRNMTPLHLTKAESLIPSLLKSYLKMGADIVCEPAYDPEFDCYDFLTVLRKENLTKGLADKYQVNK